MGGLWYAENFVDEPLEESLDVTVHESVEEITHESDHYQHRTAQHVESDQSHVHYEIYPMVHGVPFLDPLPTMSESLCDCH